MELKGQLTIDEDFQGFFGGYDGYQQDFALPTYPPAVAQMQQPLSQQEVLAVAPSTPMHMASGEFLGHLASQDTFEAPQAVAHQQPTKRLGRPPKPKVENEGPKRGRGRPAGKVDPVQRLRRGDKQKMSAEERKAYEAYMRVCRKQRDAAQAAEAAQNGLESSWEPPISASIVPQAPSEDLDSGYNSVSRPSTASFEEFPVADSGVDLGLNVDFIDFGRNVDSDTDLSNFADQIGYKPKAAYHQATMPILEDTFIPFFDASEQFPSAPAETNMGPYPQPDSYSGYYPAQQIMPPQPYMGINNCGQVNINNGPVFNSFGLNGFTYPEQTFEEVDPRWESVVLE